VKSLTSRPLIFRVQPWPSCSYFGTYQRSSCRLHSSLDIEQASLITGCFGIRIFERGKIVLLVSPKVASLMLLKCLFLCTASWFARDISLDQRPTSSSSPES